MADKDNLDIELRFRRQQAIHRAPRSAPLPQNLRQMGAVGVYVPRPPPGSQQTITGGHHVTGPRTQTMGDSKQSVAHYLTKGKGWDGADAHLFSTPERHLALSRFLAQTRHDPHQFRQFVSLAAEHAYFPMQPFIELLMKQVEKDLNRPIDWIAATHHDTKNVHTHIILRGRDRDGAPLYILNDYLTHGMRYRADRLATWFLGPQKARAQEQVPAQSAQKEHGAEPRRVQGMER